MMHSPTQSVLKNNAQSGRLQEDRKTSSVRVLYLTPRVFTEWMQNSNQLSEYVVEPRCDPWHRYEAANFWKNKEKDWYNTEDTINKLTMH